MLYFNVMFKLVTVKSYNEKEVNARRFLIIHHQGGQYPQSQIWGRSIF